ncbi:AraC family transcriptional regulator [Paenibacillus sp. PR3]|uniref:AraC family transcriptional regulator n=1 Tax=Paenibacillus terricola TaxID=2763503 RepID=A0ABR8MQ71_9BACL|nr:AraC family transcriptional regulator [Paenibacillus terricola]MBD3917196.1 AraC family transcriptional regulator [Paenibacillus terricola]
MTHSQIHRHLEEMKLTVTLAGHVRVPLEWKHHKHVTVNNCLYYFLEGDGMLEIDHHVYQPKAGEAYFLPAGAVISYSTSQINPFRQMFCHFQAYCGPIPLFRLFEPKYRIQLDNSLRIEEPFARMIEAFHSEDEWSPLACKTHMFQLLLALWDKPDDRPHLSLTRINPRANEIVVYMEEHVDGPMNIEAVATAFGYSTNYFFRYFKSTFGTTPHQYWIRLKMEHIKKLLLTTDWPIGKIAEDLSMERSHLTRLFLQYVEMTPAKFRNWMKGVSE